MSSRIQKHIVHYYIGAKYKNESLQYEYEGLKNMIHIKEKIFNSVMTNFGLTGAVGPKKTLITRCVCLSDILGD